MFTTTATFLGTGTSVGVPVIGCDCAVCSDRRPGNVRTRSSLHLQSPECSLLIDSGPDLREQALRENIRSVDAVLFTHSHLDHIAGFDELRAFCWRREDPLPLYAGQETLDALERMYPWAIQNTQKSYVRPELHRIEGPFTIADLSITPVPVQHASVETFGFRVELPQNFTVAYLSDVKAIPERSTPLLQNLDLLIIDALRPEPHPTHMSLEESLAAIDSLQPRQSILTHLAHEIDYDIFSPELPENVALAFDGLKLAIEDNSGCVMVPPSPVHHS